MAPRKPIPIQEPPAAASSEEEEEETSSEEVSSDDHGEEEEEEEEEDTQEPAKPAHPPSQQTQKQTAFKKSEIPPATPNSKPSCSDETGSESESESEPEAPPKPIATKPMEETSKAETPKSKPASKRGNETEGQKDSKRAKRKGADPDEEDQKKPGEDTKKQLFQRLWSEEDEIAVLNGMIDYSTKKDVDPNQDMNAFHDYIKKSLHVDVSKAQLVDKIRRLKKKYENNLEKGLKKGKDRIFSKQHEQKTYDLSKKLWGSESVSGVIESAAKSNGKVRKTQNQRGSNKSLAALKAELLDGAKGDKMEVDNDKEGNGVSVNVTENDKVLFNKSLGVAGLEEYVLNDGLNMIGGVKKAELRRRWKKLRIAQLELFVQRNELMNEQAELILDALKSSGN